MGFQTMVLGAAKKCWQSTFSPFASTKKTGLGAQAPNANALKGITTHQESSKRSRDPGLYRPIAHLDDCGNFRQPRTRPGSASRDQEQRSLCLKPRRNTLEWFSVFRSFREKQRTSNKESEVDVICEPSQGLHISPLKSSFA